MKLSGILTLITILTLSCGNGEKSINNPTITLNKDFNAYWYGGQAEISSYKLSQARYGEIHEGQAVLIFVTEPFLTESQVKADNPNSAKEKHTSVLKLNATRKFNTGIYPYSMMSSVFTPIDRNNYPNTLKITTSSQEWCGHTFTQLNLRKNGYEVNSFSYFESEGDQNFSLGAHLFEDEIFNLIRISPENLPIGEVKIVPSTIFQRLRHTQIKAEKADITLTTSNGVSTLTIDYQEVDRKVKINFSEAFPHEILEWEEKYQSGFGENSEVLTTRAVLDKSLKLDYWNKNANVDSVFRKKLNLED